MLTIHTEQLYRRARRNRTALELGKLMRGLGLAVFSSLLGLYSLAASAQEQRDGVYVIYDSSRSMWGELPDRSRKYEAARAAMRDLAGRDFGDRDVALRMYGHRRKDDCGDSELVVPWRRPADAGAAMVAAMETVRPTGRTPIDRSLRAALQDFGDRRGTIILISDGIESCDADPCALVREWRDRQVNITVHVVGLGLRGKERAAMECIADAAGTTYRDAFSAGELIAGLGAAVEAAAAGDKPEAGEPEPAEPVAEPQLTLTVTTADGVRQKGKATFTPVAGGAPIEVETFSIHRLPPGDYVMKGGVVTLDGSVYAPVEQRVTVRDNGLTEVSIDKAPRPPEVSARFSMDGAAIRDTVVDVHQDGRRIGSFHGDTTAFLPEGTFEFRSTPAGTSQKLSVTEVFAAGDAKEIGFDAATEVKLVVRLNMAATGDRLLSKPTLQLFRNGDLVKGINAHSGGLVFPGRYLVRADDGVNAHEAEIDVTSAPEQAVEIDLPSAAVTVTYVDADGRPEKPKRVFVYREGGRRGVTKTSDTPFALLPGTYLIDGHPKKAGYPRTTITVGADEKLTVTLRATK